MQKLTFLMALSLFMVFLGCQPTGQNQDTTQANDNTPVLSGQSGVQDNVSANDIVKVAVGSKDHTTLVAAVQAANYVDVLANAGPFTVFAPTNAAFEKLPAGTVEGLLKPEAIDDLANILEYHVYVGVIKTENMKDGQKLNQVNLKDVTITIKDGEYYVNGSKILATVPATNGVVYVIDDVLLPPE
jgi:uncharacterized surface protein with fasciclin (FAS1) repeats